MRPRSRLGLGLGLALLVAPGTGNTAPTPGQWREDLRTLADALTSIHRDAGRRVPLDSLRGAVDELDRRIPALPTHEVILGMSRIVARVGDGHTRLGLPIDYGWEFDYAHSPTPAPRDSTIRFHHLPVRCRWYDDGLAIDAVRPGFEDLLGARVRRIEGASADSAMARVRPFVSVDNDLGWRLLGAARLGCVEVLHALGIASRLDQVTLELETRDARTTRRTLPALATTGPPGWRTLAWLGGPTRLADRHPDRAWWFAPVSGHDALFIQVNRIQDTDSLRLVEFADRVARRLERDRPGRVVIDLRANTGGDGQLLPPLVRVLIADRGINRHGRLFVLVGRRTFSAAQQLANQLEHLTEALFVGEATGTTPSFHGDPRRIVLPHSGLTLRVATTYWCDWTGNESRRATEPDLPAPFRIADDLAGRDPALEAALLYRPAGGLTAQMERLHAAGGPNAAVRRVLRGMWDAGFTRAEVDSALAGLERMRERR